jgi:hypothetical protein
MSVEATSCRGAAWASGKGTRPPDSSSATSFVNNALKKTFKNSRPKQETELRQNPKCPMADGGRHVMRRIAAVAIVLAAVGTTVRAQSAQVGETDTRTLNLSAYAELLRSDVRASKVAILTELVEFSESEDKAFWPLYREYDGEMAKLGDERVALVAEYAQNYAKLTDAVADRLTLKALDLESRRQAVKAKHFERIKAVLSPRTALRFLQVEHQLNLIIDLQISAALPIVQ